MNFSKGDLLNIIARYGEGEIELSQNDYQSEYLDSKFFKFGVSGDMNLYSNENLLFAGKSELGIEGEAWKANQTVKGRNDTLGDVQTNGHHLQITAVGTHTHELQIGGIITPELSFGLRNDGINSQSFLGVLLGGGFVYSADNGYTFINKSELLMNDASQIHEWGVTGDLEFDFGNDNLGILHKLSPAWGYSATSKNSVLWNRNIIESDFDSDLYTKGAKVDAEIAYGIGIWDGNGVLTPYTGVELTQNSDNNYRLGSKLSIGTDMELELEVSHKVLYNGESNRNAN